MKPRINIITLAVDDLERGTVFYRDGLGLANPADGGDHIVFEMQSGLSLVLFPRTEIAKITGQEHGVQSSSEVIVSYLASNREEVDDILQRAEAAGGKVVGRATEKPWGYAGYFCDPDGHVWEIAFFAFFAAK